MPKSLGLLGEAIAAESGFTFLQISDSHVGFNKPANPDALGTLREAVARVKGLSRKPSFIIHTGDITHLSKPAEFDDAGTQAGGGLDEQHVVEAVALAAPLGEHDDVGVVVEQDWGGGERA